MPSSAEHYFLLFPLSLHDALPIYPGRGAARRRAQGAREGDGRRHRPRGGRCRRSEEHTSELQSLRHLVCRLLLSITSFSSLFPYTTLFRSIRDAALRVVGRKGLEKATVDDIAREAGDVVDRKSTRLNSSHLGISYAVFC